MLTEKGFMRLTYDDILERKIERAKELFGEDICTDENTPLGKFIRMESEDMAECYEILEEIYYTHFPNTATGQSLDRLMPFAGITRTQAIYARHKVRLNGTAGGLVTAPFLVSAGDIQFYTTEDCNIGTDGTVDVKVTCVDPGTIGNVQEGMIDTIVKTSAVVDSVEHIGILHEGKDMEQDPELRTRFHEAIAGAGSATADAIKAAIFRVPLVDGVEIVENDTENTVDGRPPHTFECYVLAPPSQNNLIAQAIFSRKPLGIRCVGTVEETVLDEGGKPHTVFFSRTAEKKISIRCIVKTNEFFELDGAQQIKDNITVKLNKLRSGEDVYLSSIYGYIHEITGIVNVPLLEIAAGDSYASHDITVNPREVARTAQDYIEVTIADE